MFCIPMLLLILVAFACGWMFIVRGLKPLFTLKVYDVIMGQTRKSNSTEFFYKRMII